MTGFQKLLQARGTKTDKWMKKNNRKEKKRKKKQLVVILIRNWITEDIRVFVIVLADLQFNLFQLFLFMCSKACFKQELFEAIQRVLL